MNIEQAIKKAIDAGFWPYKLKFNEVHEYYADQDYTMWHFSSEDVTRAHWKP